MNGKTFIVAELSANHGHSLDLALESVRAAREAGADAVKIQTYTADTLTIDCDSDDFVVKGTGLWDKRTLYDLYSEAYTPWEWHPVIFGEARRVGLQCFSTPFDKSAVDFLESLGNPIYKIASFEITDIPLIRYAASKHKPMIISTGVATMEDISLAVNACRSEGNEDITLLKCTSAYPAPVEDANLATMCDFPSRFGVSAGVSDHTEGCEVALAAVALGASVVEKHFILDRSIGGPDAAFSMQKDEFASMCTSIRRIEQSIGKVCYPASGHRIEGRQFSRSLYVVKDMKKGDVTTEENVRSIRPGFGLHPKYLPEVLGRKVRKDLKKGSRFSMDLIED
ncbi:MAG: pseudaminic acid synthase [Bacteroidales bacterium]|nr:pseudaminic acid synthase [Bacteroidales bacterium]